MVRAQRPVVARMHKPSAITAATLAASVGCAVTPLPPPPEPAHVLSGPVPVAETAPPGESSVVIDSDVPARVAEVTGVIAGAAGGRSMRAEQLRPLCESTPCVVHLPLGTHVLVFESTAGPGGGHGTVDVGPEASVYRYALGNTHHDNTGPALGGVLVLGGVIAAGVGVGIHKSDPSSSGAKAAGVGGFLAIGLGLILLATGRTTQTGTGVQYPAP
jgi:hypothetical protein